jgi:general secretion pathway protein K
MNPFGRQRREEGAALIVVLLLVATLSFIVLSITDRMLIASGRATNARVRAELHWRIVGAESLVASALKTAVGAKDFRYAPDNPFFATDLDIPMEGGGAIVSFRDATRCFNINSLDEEKAASAGPSGSGGEGRVRDEEGEGEREESGAEPAKPAEELARLVSRAALKDVNADAFAAVVADWIDPDSFERPGGAEDGFYTGLPTPYRSGSGALHDLSELRAMAEIDAEAYREVRPYLCVQPVADPSPVNINMLTEDDAPLLAALIGGEFSTSQADSVISDRPPGGYKDAAEFWSEDVFAGRQIPEKTKERVKVTSKYLEASAAIRFQDQTALVSMIFEVSENGEPILVARRLDELP